MTTCKHTQADRIRALNDAFRKSFVGGRVMETAGVSALSDTERFDLFATVQGFDDFSPDNDPHGEHDFGSLENGGTTYFWKIDYYDLQCVGHSPDAANPAVTVRVLTIMRADEY